MVLSNGTSRAKSYASITNQPQGGGSAKAGLPHAHTAATNVAFAVRGKGLTNTSVMRAGNGSACVSRPIGMIINVGRMKC